MNEVLRFPRAGIDRDALRLPPIDEAGARAAVLRDDGARVFAAQLVSQFESDNDGVYLAQADIELADERTADARAEKRRLARQRSRTDAWRVVVTAEREARITPFHMASGLVLIGGSAFALWMGNRVGANYIVKSGLDLYATDPDGAALFMGVALLAGGLLKVFEHRLRDDLSRTLYNAALFAVGLVAFLLWAAMMATTFAPDTGSTAWLTGEGSAVGRTATILLLLAHLVADVACSYAIFSGAEQLLLAGRRRQLIPNPVHAALTERLAAVQAAIEEQSRVRAAAEDYLRRFEAARSDLENAALLACRREAARHEQARDAASAAARSKFLEG